MNRVGYTLIEVLVTTAVLVVGLGSVMQLSALTLREAQVASEISLAEMACQSHLATLMATNKPIARHTVVAIPDLPHWTLTVTVVPSQVRGVATLTLNARRGQPAATTPRSGPHFTLTQFVYNSRIDWGNEPY
ncbi:MAG: hypothetical protein ACRC46_09900 [Thermoguttaceae bacterium]